MPGRRYIVYPQGGGFNPPTYDYRTDMSYFSKPHRVASVGNVEVVKHSSLTMNSGTTPPAPTAGVKVGASGKLVSTADGSQVNLIGVAVVGFEAAHSQGIQWPGMAAPTSANYLSAISTAVATLPVAARVYGNVNCIRVPFNSANLMAYTGITPYSGVPANDVGSNYWSVGTDSNGRAVVSGGPGGGLGSGPGHETNGDPAVYRNYLDTIVQAITGAGLYCLLDLHWGTPTLTATGQAVMPAGQCAMPGPLDAAAWAWVASKYGSNPMVLFELYNEPFGTNGVASKANIPTESKYLGNFTGDTSYAFPTATTSPSSTNGGYLMLNNLGNGNSLQAINISGLGANQTCQAVGYQAMLDAVRNAGGTNVCLVGNIFYTGDPSQWSYAGGTMAVADSYKPGGIGQTGAAWHSYGFAGGDSTFHSIQSAGLPFVCTEQGSIAINSDTYVNFRAQGWGYFWWSPWNNFGNVSNIYTQGPVGTAPFGRMTNPPWGDTSNSNYAPTGTN